MATSVLLGACHQVAVPDEIDDRWDLEANKSPVVNVFSETSLTCSADFEVICNSKDIQSWKMMKPFESMRSWQPPLTGPYSLWLTA